MEVFFLPSWDLGHIFTQCPTLCKDQTSILNMSTLNENVKFPFQFPANTDLQEMTIYPNKIIIPNNEPITEIFRKSTSVRFTLIANVEICSTKDQICRITPTFLHLNWNNRHLLTEFQNVKTTEYNLTNQKETKELIRDEQFLENNLI